VLTPAATLAAYRPALILITAVAAVGTLVALSGLRGSRGSRGLRRRDLAAGPEIAAGSEPRPAARPAAVRVSAEFATGATGAGTAGITPRAAGVTGAATAELDKAC
jgi:hypothetical protein